MKTDKTFFTDKPRLAVTLGDPAGIGPEVILKALADPEVTKDCEITVIGSQALLQATYTQLLEHGCVLANPDLLSILDIPHTTGKLIGGLDPSPTPPLLGEGLRNSPFPCREGGGGVRSVEGEIVPGVGNVASGAASFAYLEKAIALTLAGEFDGIVTAPIAKSLWKAAGHEYPGQTEVLAKYAGVERFGMLFVARSPHTGWLLRTLLATTHIPLCQVSTTLNPELMSKKLDLLVECLRQDFGLETPRIAISGLNPHSGEQGQLGREEQDWLIPWLEQEREKRPELRLDGPVPPDTLWVKAGQAWYGDNSAIQNAKSEPPQPPLVRGEFGMQNAQSDPPQPPFVRGELGLQNLPDAYLALYHDQGLIPVKLMAFDRAINTTIGLPFVRTSPDHGTAFDIAGYGVANPTSMKAAIQLAAELVNHSKSATS